MYVCMYVSMYVSMYIVWHGDLCGQPVMPRPRQLLSRDLEQVLRAQVTPHAEFAPPRKGSSLLSLGKKGDTKAQLYCIVLYIGEHLK